MLKHYIFWGLFALVLIGMAATLIRDRRKRLKREAAEAKSRAMPASGDSAADGIPKKAFDPAATRVHVGSSPAVTNAELPDREEVKLPNGAIPRLVCVGGSQKEHSFPVTDAGITVGRGKDNDIVITDPRASHRHAWVGIVDRKVVLLDLGSTNGTFLNAKIDAPVGEAVLSPGDTIFFGGHGRDQFRLVVD